jgi:Tfp pilus tip-associated adhesin PilY1
VAAIVTMLLVAESIGPALAAPTVSQVPLATLGAEQAKPNFLFILDDSGSMNLEYMPGGDPGSGSELRKDMAGAWSSACNKLYFNPDPKVTYSLPPDPTSLGFLALPATVTTFTAAPVDGFKPLGGTRDLSRSGPGGFEFLGHTGDRPFHYRFEPAGNRTFDETRDCRVPFAFENGAAPLEVPVVVSGVTVGRWKKQALAATDGDRFARWYSFYRTRLNAMKSAAGLAFSYPTVDDRMRIGFITTTPSADGVTAGPDTPVAPSRFLPVRDFDDAWKREWMKKLYETTAAGTTPLRLALSRAGWYFAGRTDGPATGMIAAPLDAKGEPLAASGPAAKMGDPVKYSCQRNYAMLVTDGYWTNESGVSQWSRGAVGTPCTSASSFDCAIRSLDSGSLDQVPAPFNDTARLWKVDRNVVQALRFDATERTSASTEGIPRCRGADVGNPVPLLDDFGKMRVYRCDSPACETRELVHEQAVSLAADAVDLEVPVARGMAQPGGAPVRITGAPRFAEVWHHLAKEETYFLRPKGYTRRMGYRRGERVDFTPADRAGLYGAIGVADAPKGTVIGAVVDVAYRPASNDNFFGVPVTSTDPSWGPDMWRGVVYERFAPGLTARRHRTMDTHAEYWGTTLRTRPAGSSQLQSREERSFFVGCARMSVNCWRLENGAWGCNTDEDVSRMRANREPAGIADFWNAGPPPAFLAARDAGSVRGREAGRGTPTPLPDVEADALALGMQSSDGSLADVAAAFYERPLRTGTQRGINFDERKVPPSGDGPEDDRATWQHMTTFTMGLGVSGFLDYSPKYRSPGSPNNAFDDIRRGFSADDQPASGAKVWPPVDRGDEIAKIDDLWHAAVNGRGMYLAANDANDARDRLETALNAIKARPASGAGASGSTANPTGDDRQIFWTTYRSGVWSGDLRSAFVDLDPASRSYGGATGPFADARTKVTARAKEGCDDRTVLLMQGRSLKDFAWAGQTRRCSGASGGTTRPPAFSGTRIDDPLLEALDPGAATWRPGGSTGGDSVFKSNDDGRKPWDLVHWIRGQSGNEYPQVDERLERFRSRTDAGSERNILGDFVGSQPLHLGKSGFSYSDPGYPAFRASVASRAPMVYVASNAGMLHAFRAGSPDPAVNDARRLEEAWAVIPSQVAPKLALTAQRGYSGKHQFILDGTPVAGDVYAPETVGGAFAWRTLLVVGRGAGGAGYAALDVTDPENPKALWEVTGGGGAGACNDNASDGGRHVDCRLGLSLGNPIITKVRSNAPAWAAGRWVVIFASGYDTPDGLAYIHVRDAGTGLPLYRAQIPASGTVGAEVGLARLSAYVKASQIDNTAEAVYGGDLLGNLWKFDTSAPIETWTGGTANVKLLARFEAGNPAVGQPITSRPELGTTGTEPIVFVGTGRYLNEADMTSKANGSVYAVVDRGAEVPVTRAMLERREFSAPDGAATVKPVSGTAPNGWYIDLPNAGERVVVDPTLQLGSLAFVSSVPGADPCDVGGSSFLNYVDFRTGAAIPAADGSTTARVPMEGGMGTGLSLFRLPDGRVVNTSPTSRGGNPDTRPVSVKPGTVSGRRVSWRELAQ